MPISEAPLVVGHVRVRVRVDPLRKLHLALSEAHRVLDSLVYSLSGRPDRGLLLLLDFLRQLQRRLHLRQLDMDGLPCIDGPFQSRDSAGYRMFFCRFS